MSYDRCEDNAQFQEIVGAYKKPDYNGAERLVRKQKNMS